MTFINSAEDTARTRTPFTILALDYQGGFQGNGSEFTELYKITFSDHTWSTPDLFAYKEFPRKYQAAKDPRLAKDGYYVSNVQWERDRDLPQVCNLQITVTNEMTNQGQIRNKDIEYEPDPTKRPPIITFNTYTTREVQSFAYPSATAPERTQPIQTTALEPILYTEERKRRQIVIEMNVSELPLIMFNEYEVCNRSPIKIPRGNSLRPATYTFPPETLKLHEITTTTEIIENKYRFYKVTAVLQHRQETWRFRPRNVGRQAYKLIKVKNPVNGQLIIKRSSTPSLIRIGNPPELPISPLPLRNTPDKPAIHGLVFQDYYNYDIETKEFKFDQDAITPERLEEIFKEATLDFIVLKPVDFAAFIPGLSFYN